jgi:hypothetical protein
MLYFGRLKQRAPKISSLDWPGLEKLYGRTIPVDVRVSINSAIANYAFVAWMEATAVPIRDVLAEIQKMERAALIIRKLLTAGQNNITDPRRYLQHLVRNHFRDPRFTTAGDVPARYIPKEDPVRALVGILDSLAAAIESSRRELANPDYAIVEGGAWVIWIRSLRRILREAGLPTAARKDGGPLVSPFVALVDGLQRLLPPQLTRHHGDLGLAQAIARVR